MKFVVWKNYLGVKFCTEVWTLLKTASKIYDSVVWIQRLCHSRRVRGIYQMELHLLIVLLGHYTPTRALGGRERPFQDSKLEVDSWIWKFCKKLKIRKKNRNFGKKLKFSKKSNIRQKSKFWQTKIVKSALNRKFCKKNYFFRKKSKFGKKLKLGNKSIIRQISKCWQKIQNSAKNRKTFWDRPLSSNQYVNTLP